jgi:molybdenum cofactor cytidylyltransferase
MIHAIVLAAGASSRMGRAKAALTLGQTGETLVARVIRTLLSGGAPGVAVVAGAHVDAVRKALPLEPRARLIEHPQWQQGQLSSLLAGLDAIDDPQLEGALVTLVDVPLVASSTVAAVIAEWRRTRAPIVRPVHGDRHGHPVMFDRSVFPDLRAADPAVGAKAVFEQHRLRIVNVEVNDPGAFEDIDTAEEYNDLRSRISEG